MIKKVIKTSFWSMQRSVEGMLYRTGLRSMTKLTLPDFIGLGPGQTGSTWLSDQLSRHARVTTPRQKETHYFDQGYREYSRAFYASQFAHGHGGVRGEICPGYSILTPERIREVYKLVPKVRLIITLRNPVERSWSSLRRTLGKQGSAPGDYEDDLIRTLLDQEWSYSGPLFPSPSGDYQPGLLEGFYSQAIDNWLAVFPQEQMLVTFFDELKEQPSNYLARVCEHIGVNSDSLVDQTGLNKQINPNPVAVMPEQFETYLKQKYAREIDIIKQRYGSWSMQW